MSMMAAYAPQPGMHPGMTPHGHPGMAPGQPMTSAQMQQMGHPGLAGPGAPQVTQAGAMMGMHPGASGMGGQMGGMPNHMASMPGGMNNAAAMNQMNPQLLQQLQAQQQGTNQNQQIMQQARQQEMMRHHMMRQQQQQQGQTMTPQHIAQLQHMQQSSQVMPIQGVALTTNLEQQQANLRRQQQQQQQQQQMAQLAHQQQLAMQQANSQQGSQGGQPGPPSQQSGQVQQPPMRPQSRMATSGAQSQGQPQPNPQPTAQSQDQQQGQQQGQPNQQQSQQQQAQQQGMTPQQQQFMMQQRQGQSFREQQQRQQHSQQIAQQQEGIMRRQMPQQQQNNGQFFMRVMSLCDSLSVTRPEVGQDNTNWHGVVDKHFAPEGRLVHVFTDESGSSKSFEVLRHTIAMYFQTYFESGATAIRIYVANQPPFLKPVVDRYHLAFQTAVFTVHYGNGARLEMTGSMNFMSAPGSDLIDCMEIETTHCEDFIVRSKIEETLKEWNVSTDAKNSPKMTKKPPKAQQKLQSALEGLTIDAFPKTPRGPFGPRRVQQFLEIGETMNVMSELVSHSQETKLRPHAALESLVAQYESLAQQGNPQINLPPNSMMGNRTPSMANMAMPGQPNPYSSPAMSNLNAPMMNGSPHISHNAGLTANMNMRNSHTPSPHQSNMAAPPMMPQHSQQGTNSSAASANTSPNVNNKRRRSTVKMEGDDGGGEGGSGQGQNRVKPSPRLKKTAKPGGG